MTNKYNYKVEIIKLSEDDGGGFLAEVPKLPGCISDGETREEALVNVQDAIKCWIETAEELNRKIPLSEEYKEEEDFSGKLSLRIPKSLHKNISEMAEKEGCSINQLIMMYISMGVGNEFGKKHVSVNVTAPDDLLQRLVNNKWDNFSSKRLNTFEFDDKPIILS